VEYTVDHDIQTAAYRATTAHPFSSASSTASATSSENAPSFPSLFAQIEDLLGTQTEPDPQFFVETWTNGVEAASQSFQTRHQVASHHDNPSTFRAFDFSMPLIIVQDGSPDAAAFPSKPAGFSAAWKNAYGVSQAPHVAPKNPPAHDELPFQPVPGLPTTIDDAYRMLGVTAASTRKQIKAAYRQLAWRYHPDRLEHSTEPDLRRATNHMMALNAAYHLLSGTTTALTN
jgi:DnaJ-domain-containing protein 1